MSVQSVIPKISKETRDDCLQLYIVGFEPHEIGKRTGLNENTIRGWVMKEKWAARRRRQEELNAEKNPIEERPLVKAFASKKGKLKEEFIEKAGEMAVNDVKHWHGMEPQERLVVATDMAALNKMHRDNLGLNEEKEEGDKGHINLVFLTSSENKVRELGPNEVKEITDAEPPISAPE